VKRNARQSSKTGRSYVAVAAHMRNSAGTMGGGKRTKNRRDRQAARNELRSYR
jgi:hypothetical protein